MKRLGIILVGVMFFVASCENESLEVNSENVYESVLPKDGMIKEAENFLGVLYKEERVFTDSKSGSQFKMIFAASDKSKLIDFFDRNSVEVNGISEEFKQKLLRESIISIKESKSQNLAYAAVETTSEGFVENDVYYDLVSKNLKKEDVGFSFSIRPLVITNPNLKSAIPAGLNWRQQTSLPWCEIAAVDMIFESPAQGYTVYTQSRGLVWSNGMPVNQALITDGSRYLFNVDDKKYYRFGGYDPTIYKFNVTWYDLESGNSVTN